MKTFNIHFIDYNSNCDPVYGLFICDKLFMFSTNKDKLRLEMAKLRLDR